MFARSNWKQSRACSWCADVCSAEQGAYSRKVVKGGRCYDRSYDWFATAVGIHETNRTCDRRKFDRISTTYL